ncbi:MULTISPECIES: branched-chain amino acid ABC transporter substrate-binding protein [Rhodomicrobium]|uniref:branched-chain amino acid ABC transporter substrate-binding protein n=1 Tax=Rhodomicrobium TaxID=1068 RepID=UPI000B4B1E4A|nr:MULTISPECIES: branched-chain amino acid ABC transporter substrate-binding protein [Rhodomicrobium]
MSIRSFTQRSLIGAAALAAALTSGFAANAQDVIKIAVGAPLTGALAKQGQEVANAVQLAVDEWNAKGGVLGKKIELVPADDGGNPQVGVAAGEKVAADPAILGTVWGITSSTCLPVSEILDRSNIVMITPGCSNPKVTDRGLKTVHRLCARDDFQAPAGVIFSVNDLKAKNIAIIDDGTAGPRGQGDEAEKQAKAMGAKVTRFVIRAGDKDFRAILGTIPKDTDVIYASIWAPEAALIAKQLPDVGLKVKMVGPDGLYEPVDYVQASGGAAEGNYVTFFVPDMKKIPSASAFVSTFEGKYGPISSYGPLAYEAANILLDSIKRAGKADRAAVSAAVRKTDGFKGILGMPISFDAKGDVAKQSLSVYQVKGTGFELVKTISNAK